MKAYTDIEKLVIHAVGSSFLGYHKMDYNLTYNLIASIDFKQIRVVVNSNHSYDIYFLVSRPGVLIGKQGKVINHLTKALKENLCEEVEIHIEESYLDRLLYPIDYNSGEF